MRTKSKTEDLVRLYQLFGQSIRENDACAVRQFYRELRDAGRPLQEILEEATANAASIEGLERTLLDGDDSFDPQPVVTPKLIQHAAIPVALARMFETTAKSRLVWLTSGMAISAIGCFVLLSLMPVQFGRGPPMPSRGTTVTIAERPSAEAEKARSSAAELTESWPASLLIEHSPPNAVAGLGLIAQPPTLTEPTPEPEAQQTSLEKSASGPPEPKIEPATIGDKDASPSASISDTPLSNAEKLELLKRGDALFSVGDITTARQFYQRAAEAGHGEAAVRLGESYDPAFLRQAGLRGVLSDVTAARLWYRRAVQLGAQEAEILLEAIETD